MPTTRQLIRLNPGHKKIDTLPPNSNRITMYQANVVQQEAVHYITQKEWLRANNKTWTPRKLEESIVQQEINISRYCAPVIHPVTGKIITQNREFSRDPTLSEVWTTVFGKEFGNLTQGGQKTGTRGTNAMFVMIPEQIKRIIGDRIVTYAKIVAEYWSQQSEPNRVRITAGGNLLKYPGELSTKVADLKL